MIKAINRGSLKYKFNLLWKLGFSEGNLMNINRRIITAIFLIWITSISNSYADTIKVTSSTISLNIDAKSTLKVRSNNTIDYANAIPLDVPTPFSINDTSVDSINSFTGIQVKFDGTPTGQPGYKGNGKQTPVFVGAKINHSSEAITPMAYGTGNQPFTTARADLSSPTNTMYPYRATGKLFFKIGTASYMCSASLIKKGLILTAAHCVSSYGTKTLYTNFQFIPGYRNGVGPYGNWSASKVIVPTSYYTGKPESTCYSGVLCKDDVALITVAPQSAKYPGTQTGHYGYGMNGYGYTPTGLTHITQLGYPGTLDNGNYMEITNSIGLISTEYLNNTIIGSNMGGGSSGGPWIINFGYAPTLTGAGKPSGYNQNTVVGVTSWGYNSTDVMQMGASPFLSSNLGALITSACSNKYAGCL